MPSESIQEYFYGLQNILHYNFIWKLNDSNYCIMEWNQERHDFQYGKFCFIYQNVFNKWNCTCDRNRIKQKGCDHLFILHSFILHESNDPAFSSKIPQGHNLCHDDGGFIYALQGLQKGVKGITNVWAVKKEMESNWSVVIEKINTSTTCSKHPNSIKKKCSCKKLLVKHLQDFTGNDDAAHLDEADTEDTILERVFGSKNRLSVAHRNEDIKTTENFQMTPLPECTHVAFIFKFIVLCSFEHDPIPTPVDCRNEIYDQMETKPERKNFFKKYDENGYMSALKNGRFLKPYRLVNSVHTGFIVICAFFA